VPTFTCGLVRSNLPFAMIIFLQKERFSLLITAPQVERSVFITWISN
jgi:hypothetical protein